MIRLTRTVTFLGADIQVEAVLPDDAGPREVVLAARELEDAARTLREACAWCGTPFGQIHFPDCLNAPADLIASAHAEAVAAGMAP